MRRRRTRPLAELSPIARLRQQLGPKAWLKERSWRRRLRRIMWRGQEAIGWRIHQVVFADALFPALLSRVPQDETPDLG